MNAQRRTELRGAAGGGHRAAARDLSRAAQRHLHARLRLVAGLRRSLRSRQVRSRSCFRRRPTEGLDLQTDASRRPRRRSRGWDSRRARRSSQVLDEAIADTNAKVQVIAYDLNEPEIVTRLQKLGSRLRVIIDDSADHGEDGSAEDAGGRRGCASRREPPTSSGSTCSGCSTTRPSWSTAASGARSSAARRTSAGAVSTSSRTTRSSCAARAASQPFSAAFESYCAQHAGGLRHDAVGALRESRPDRHQRQVAFSPHAPANCAARHRRRGHRDHTTSCLFYSLAFLFQTRGRSGTPSRR